MDPGLVLMQSTGVLLSLLSVRCQLDLHTGVGVPGWSGLAVFVSLLAGAETKVNFPSDPRLLLSDLNRKSTDRTHRKSTDRSPPHRWKSKNELCPTLLKTVLVKPRSALLFLTELWFRSNTRFISTSCTSESLHSNFSPPSRLGY